MAKEGQRGKKLPPLPPGAPGRPVEQRYKEQYGVIVLCKRQSLAKSKGGKAASGYGGHFRAIQGFRYLGE